MTKEEQSSQDKQVVTIKPCDNGYIVRIYPCTLVFATLAEVMAHVEKHFKAATSPKQL